MYTFKIPSQYYLQWYFFDQYTVLQSVPYFGKCHVVIRNVWLWNASGNISTLSYLFSCFNILSVLYRVFLNLSKSVLFTVCPECIITPVCIHNQYHFRHQLLSLNSTVLKFGSVPFSKVIQWKSSPSCDL